MDQRSLSRIEVFVFKAPWPAFCGPESSGNSCCGILKLTCKAGYSWAQGVLCADHKEIDLMKWSGFLHTIRHCRLDEAIEIVRRLSPEWEQTQREMVQMALLDLKAKLQGKVLSTHIQTDLRLRAAAAGNGLLSPGQMYYKPSRSLKHQQSWTELDMAELIDKSIAYYSIL
ncbi:hypothetical protein KIH86_07945 [Paenibacillus sp. HN-1]|uniref:hypothetical protein n=1 Tax=Paenibacillus TaxID=44249 RepID=UPI001CA97198|nr:MULTISPECIES: hypothetical protein [Paenibacillus]MBY9078634.1 hypothetical protein [Paenibacillus sp. CGMCC 1.18879]MBY9084170.1 hypothetical protein [Paenibacillus sinensis]